MFSDYLDRGALVNPGGVWATDGETTLTHAEALELTHRVAVAIAREGLRPGDHVAVYSPNDVTALVCIHGLLRAGVTWVALNPYAKPAELSALIGRAGCDYLLYHGSFADDAPHLLDSEPRIRGATGFGDELSEAFEAWLGPAGERFPRLPFDREAVVMILGSGGTTGAPKPIPLEARQCLAMSLAFNAHMPEERPPTYLMATPMTHAAGPTAWPVLAEGGSVVVQAGVRPDRVFEAIERHSVSRLFLPPTAIYKLLEEPGVESVDFGSLRHFVYAAAPMSADRLERSLEVFGPVMTQTFGQAEAPMICTCLTPREHVEALADPARRERLKSAGRPSLVAAVEIMDPDGALLGPGEVGEIVVRGDLVMSGYHGDPAATETTRRPGGWHGTSDLGYRDEEGFVYIVDRQRDMIISGGFNVFPSEVERVIWRLPGVLDCAVIGIPDEKWGEAVTAFVELKEGEGIEEATVVAACREELGGVKAPKSVVLGELPRTANGKVAKRILREPYWEGRDRRV